MTTIPRVLRALASAIVTAVLLSGCGGDGDPASVGAAAERDPGREVVGALVDAAAAGDAESMWNLLTEPSRRRHGGTLRQFEQGEAKRLRKALAPYVGGDLPVSVSENVDGTFGLVALSRGADAWATPLRLEGHVWRIELSGPLRIAVTGPPPRSTGRFANQVSIELSGLDGNGVTLLYLDGVTLDVRNFSARTTATAFANFASGIEPGRHTVTAFATSGDRAAARAWTFVR